MVDQPATRRHHPGRAGAAPNPHILDASTMIDVYWLAAGDQKNWFYQFRLTPT
jgi:hypothetical protein